MYSKKLLAYLLQGLLLLAPIVVTVYIIFALFRMLDTSVNYLLLSLFNVEFPGLGIIILFFLITAVGYLSSTFFFQPIFNLIEQAISRAPLVNIIYTSMKDFISAFLSDKKKFNQPVVVNINGRTDFQKLGFITRSDLSFIGLKDKVSVYLPHSYNFSGNLFIVDAKNVTPLDVPVAQFMKFIVSGGITEWDVLPEKESAHVESIESIKTI